MMKSIRILFKNVGDCDTLIQEAYKSFQHKDVIDVVEETLAWHSPTTPINSTDVLLLAAIDKINHLDGVYFLLRRHPDVLLRLILPRLTNNNNSNNNNNSYNTGDQENNVNNKQRNYN